MKHLTIPFLIIMFFITLLGAMAYPRRIKPSKICEKLNTTSRRIYKKHVKDLYLSELLTVIITNNRECNDYE